MTGRAVWLVLAACAGCSRSIRLGELPDAPPMSMPPDAATAFTTGPYMASFLEPIQTQCTGTLTGHESDFAAITPAGLNLEDGQMMLAAYVDHADLSGATIQTAFGQATLVLMVDPAATPPTLWDTAIIGSFGSGPDSTSATQLAFALDSSTAHDPDGIQGAYARLFETSDMTGACSATFGALLVSM